MSFASSSNRLRINGASETANGSTPRTSGAGGKSQPPVCPSLKRRCASLRSTKSFGLYRFGRFTTGCCPDAPLKHTAKPDFTYSNDAKSYRTLCDLLARGRVEGRIPWQAIDDETRPEMLNNHFWNTGQFFEDQINRFLRGYTRNRQQSQPNHIEVVAEKLTVKTILELVAARYSIPLTINRGMSGPTVKKKIANRFWASGKQQLILLVVSDLDPAGDAIAQDIRDAFERDFDIDEDHIETYKMALTIDQVVDLALDPSMEAKESFANLQRVCRAVWDHRRLRAGGAGTVMMKGNIGVLQ